MKPQSLPTSRLNLFLAALALFFATTQITLGGVVRVTGSGDACPDWPLCFGAIVPEFTTFQVALEWTHRANGVVLGGLVVVILVLFIVSYIRKQVSVQSLITVSLAFVAVVVAGVVGGLVVLSELDPAIRALHLILAELSVLFLAATFIFALKPHGAPFRKPRGSGWIAAILLVILLAVLVSGAYLVWRNVGTACTGWPLCGSGGAPLIPQSLATWINMAHRIVVGVAFLVALVLTHILMRRANHRILKTTVIVVLALLTLEIVVGAAIPMTLRFWSDGYDLMRATHLAVSGLSWLGLCLLAAPALIRRTWLYGRQ